MARLERFVSKGLLISFLVALGARTSAATVFTGWSWTAMPRLTYAVRSASTRPDTPSIGEVCIPHHVNDVPSFRSLDVPRMQQLHARFQSSLRSSIRSALRRLADVRRDRAPHGHGQAPTHPSHLSKDPTLSIASLLTRRTLRHRFPERSADPSFLESWYCEGGTEGAREADQGAISKASARFSNEPHALP